MTESTTEIQLPISPLLQAIFKTLGEHLVVLQNDPLMLAATIGSGAVCLLQLVAIAMSTLG